MKVLERTPNVKVFRTQQLEWKADDLQDIRCDPSGMTINHRSVQELQCFPKKTASMDF